MGYLNYFCGIVKILEKPLQKFGPNKLAITVVRAELPQSRNKQCITLQFWGKLARDIKKYYNTNDYILIEGYISISTNEARIFTPRNSSQILLSVLKMYPLVLKGFRSFVN